MTTKTKMMRSGVVAAVLAASAAVTAAPAWAQDFEWRGRIDRGDVLEVRGINGRIDASAASGNQIEVTAVKTEGRKGDPDDVTFDVVEHAGGVTICAIYPNKPGKRENRCAPGDSHMSNYDNDTRVDFTVRVPAGVNLEVGTVNGDVDVKRIDGSVKAWTVNGDVDVESGGNAEASTVNGSIRAMMEKDLDSDLKFNTVNGSVTVGLPSGANADVEAATVNGSLESDFPLTVQGRFMNRRLRGKIGDGGHRLELETVNGGITIRRS
ncbi:MAG: DUF4097 family beta strand repeat-containing protein [Gemmatimonadales bacterium]|jgi:hypothetical protein